MKVKLLMVGKTVQQFISSGFENYQQRMVHYIPFEYKVISELKKTKNLSEKQQKTKEGELIINQI